MIPNTPGNVSSSINSKCTFERILDNISKTISAIGFPSFVRWSVFVLVHSIAVSRFIPLSNNSKANYVVIFVSLMSPSTLLRLFRHYTPRAFNTISQRNRFPLCDGFPNSEIHTPSTERASEFRQFCIFVWRSTVVWAKVRVIAKLLPVWGRIIHLFVGNRSDSFIHLQYC